MWLLGAAVRSPLKPLAGALLPGKVQSHRDCLRVGAAANCPLAVRVKLRSEPETPQEVAVVTPGVPYLFIRQPHGSEVSPAVRNTLDSARIPRASKLLIVVYFKRAEFWHRTGSGNPDEVDLAPPMRLERPDRVRRSQKAGREPFGLCQSPTTVDELREPPVVITSNTGCATPSGYERVSQVPFRRSPR